MGNSSSSARCVHVVCFDCKSEELAKRCIQDLEKYSKPDAILYGCKAFEYGFKEGATKDCVYVYERWDKWEDLNKMQNEKFRPNHLPIYNELLKRPFDISMDTLRVVMQGKY